MATSRELPSTALYGPLDAYLLAWKEREFALLVES
jgi:hypothetical protein